MTDRRAIGFWLKLVDRLTDERSANTVEEHGVTRRQWQLLNVLSRGQATGARLDAALAPFLTAIGLAGTALFQVALASGVPWGAAARGGLYAQLPPQLRVSSAISAVVLVAAAALVLRRAGFWGAASTPVRVLTWVLVPLLALSALGNFASASRWENLLMGPLALLLSVMCAMVARSRPTSTAA